MFNTILLIGSIAAALITIGTLLGKLFDKVKNVIEIVNDIQEKNEENYMNNLRIIIMSEEMPIGERLSAGEKYIKNNGNGEIKAFVKKLEKEYLNQK